MKKDKKAKNEKKLSPFSKKTLDGMKQYKEHTKHTQSIELGERVSCKIRLQETIFGDRPPEIGVDVRKWLDDKYPFRGGIQGILISKDRWLEFMQKATDFTISVFGKEVFYSDEPIVAPVTIAPQKTVLKEVVKSIEKPLRKKSVEETNWGAI